MNHSYEVFLGGHDAEMKTIADLARNNGLVTHDKGLGWGAKASAYAKEIRTAIEQSNTPVLIELTYDLTEDIRRDQIVEIDHHGDRAHEEASILQFADLVGVTRTRMMQLIGANDSGYIPAMQQSGATPEEIAQIRALERREQGISMEQERQAEEAIEAMTRFPESADLIVVRLPHSKVAPVTDRLHGTQDRQNSLILSGDGEVNYFGDGVLCEQLKEQFEGWNGGSGLGKKGETAFWGGYPGHEEVEEFIKRKLS